MEAEPRSSEPPPLPRPQSNPDWPERVAVWRERLVDLGGGAKAWLGLTVVLVVAVAVGVGWFGTRTKGPPIEALLPPVDPTAIKPASSDTPETGSAGTALVVHVAGAVTRPGLVELTPPARVADAIEAAGGATSAADLDRLNLAVLLHDEDRVLVPEIGQDVPALITGPDSQTQAEGPLDLNRASPAELEQLPGVGPATAAAIVAYRSEHGSFGSVTELDNVNGIGPARLAQLRDLVVVEP